MRVRYKFTSVAVGALAMTGVFGGVAMANPNNSGAPPAAENLSYLSGPMSQAFWIGSGQAGSQLNVGYALAGPYNPGAPYGGGYAKAVLHNFLSTLPTAAPAFNYTGPNVAGGLRWYIEFTGTSPADCQITAAQQDATPLSPAYANPPCYVFGYPSVTDGTAADGSGGAPFIWELHLNGTVTYTTDWNVVLSTFGNQPVNDVRVVADNSGANAPFTDVITNVEYGGVFPTP
jgi:hypothetical protein